MANKYLDNNGLLYLWQKITNLFVKKDGNKVLSTNDYTTEDKEKLQGLENYVLPTASATEKGGIIVGDNLIIDETGKLSATASESKIEGIQVNGTDQEIVDKKVNISVPTDNSQLLNGAGYQTASDTTQSIETALQDYTKTQDLEEVIKGQLTDYATETYVDSGIETATEDMATQTWVNSQITNLNKKEVVSSLEEMTDSNIIYLLANQGSGNNIYDEYLVVNNKPEKIGTTEVDLTNYLKKEDMIAITNQEIDEIVAS